MPAPTSTRSARLLERLALPGWDLEVEEALRGGIACTRAVVGGDDVVVRTHGAHRRPDRRRPRCRRGWPSASLAVFRALAAVESALHRRPVDQVHFHEVGGHDAIIDIVGTAAALEVLGVDEVTRLGGGHGTGHGAQRARAAAQSGAGHGPPARGGPDLRPRRRRWSSRRRPAPRCWPRCATSFGPLPAMTVDRLGLRRRRRRDGRPAQLHPGGDRAAPRGRPPSARASRRSLLETNLDDVTGEQLGYAVAAALEAGAFDAWVSPVTMKKGRPGHVLHVLTDAAHVEALRGEIHADDRDHGGPGHAVERWPVARDARPGHRRRHRRPHEGQRRAGQARVRRRRAGWPPRPGPPLHEVASRAEEAWRLASASRPRPGPGGRTGLMASADVPLRRGDDRPDPGGLPGTPVHGPGRPRLRRPRRVARRRAGRPDAARGQRRRRGAASSSWTSWRRPSSRATARASCRSSRPHPPRPRSSSTCSSPARRCTAPPGSRRPASSWPRTRPSACWPRRPASPPGAGGCFVAGGSAGNLSALMVARDTAGHRRRGDGPAASARRPERGRPLLGGQGAPRARRRGADRADATTTG